jgi:hypothetical protein
MGHIKFDGVSNEIERLGDRNLRRRCQAATLQIEQQITPRL